MKRYFGLSLVFLLTAKDISANLDVLLSRYADSVLSFHRRPVIERREWFYKGKNLLDKGTGGKAFSARPFVIASDVIADNQELILDNTRGLVKKAFSEASPEVQKEGQDLLEQIQLAFQADNDRFGKILDATKTNGRIEQRLCAACLSQEKRKQAIIALSKGEEVSVPATPKLEPYDLKDYFMEVSDVNSPSRVKARAYLESALKMLQQNVSDRVGSGPEATRLTHLIVANLTAYKQLNDERVKYAASDAAVLHPDYKESVTICENLQREYCENETRLRGTQNRFSTHK